MVAGRWCRSSNLYRLLAGTVTPPLSSVPLTSFLDSGTVRTRCPVETGGLSAQPLRAAAAAPDLLALRRAAFEALMGVAR